jgi:hypothetical protein
MLMLLVGMCEHACSQFRSPKFRKRSKETLQPDGTSPSDKEEPAPAPGSGEEKSSKKRHHSPAELDAHEAEFAVMDTNGDGALTVAEVVLSGMDEGIKPEDAAAFVDELDLDGDLTVSWDEYDEALHGQDYGKAEL